MTENMQMINVDGILSKYHLILTGSSGFIGMAILYQFLQISYPANFLNDKKNIENGHQIFCILRKPKQYATITDRLREEMFTNSIFSEYSKDEIEYLLSKQKVVGIDAELTAPCLNLNEKQYNQLEFAAKEGAYFIHCAADIQFDRPFNDAMDINVNGTYQCLELCKKMNIKNFIHISTLYTNSREGRDERVMEKIYNQGFNPTQLFEQWMASNKKLDEKYIMENVVNQKDNSNVNQRTKWPNTYTLTKNIAEHVAYDYCNKNNINLAITRLGIVCPVRQGKHEGWFLGTGGFVLVVIGTAQGHIKYFKGDGKGRPDLVPVDHTVSALFAIAADLIVNSNSNVFNIGISANQDDNWSISALFGYCIPRFQEKHLPGSHSNIRVRFIDNDLLFFLIEFFKYDVPLFFISLLQYWPLIQQIFSFKFWCNLITMTCTHLNNNLSSSDNDIKKKNQSVENEILTLEKQLNQKPSKLSKKITFLTKAREKMKNFTSNYAYFLNQRWRFDFSNVKALYAKLDDESRAKYNFDVDKIDINEYASTNSVLVMHQWIDRQQIRKKEQGIKEEKLQKKLQELKEAKLQASFSDIQQIEMDNNNKMKQFNEKKIWQIIQRLGVNLGGIGIYNFCISLAFTLGLLWIVFSL